MSGEVVDGDIIEEPEEDPFGDCQAGKEEEVISERMVKKITYLIHKLADRRGQDFIAIQKKCKKLFAYTNLAKVSLEEGHKIIDKLIELTGGEEEKEEEKEEKSIEGAKITDDGSKDEVGTVSSPPVLRYETGSGEAKVLFAVRKAVEITLREVDGKIPTQGLGGFVLDMTRIILTEKDLQEQKEKEAD